MVEMSGGTCTVVTGLRAAPEVHREDAISCRKRLYATGIDAGSGPEQPGAVCNDPRGSAYPTTRTGRKGAPGADLPAVGRRREGGTGSSTGEGRVVQLLSYPKHYLHQSGTELLAAGGRGRALLPCRVVAKEKG